MDPRLARRAAATAFVAGIAADLLFDRVGLGINVPIATVAILALVTWLGPNRRPADRLDLWLPGVAILASLGPALRTDPSVVVLDLGLVAVATAAWSVAMSGVPVTRRAASSVIVLGGVAGLVATVALAWLVTRSGADGFFSRGFGQLGRFAAIARGMLIAVPVVAGFSLLLASADAVFGRALDEALNLPIDLGEAVDRGAFSVLAAGLVAGPLALAAGGAGVFSSLGLRSGTGTAATAAAEAQPTTRTRRVGAVETLTVLAAVDVLFAAFAVVQVVYLFGGVDTLGVVGMTYSDYARQGYFQLVGVVGLAGLLLLGAHEVIGRTRPFLTLGEDAVPDLVAALAVLAPPERQTLLVQLQARRDELASDPTSAAPLSWNLSRARARAALETLPER